MHSLVGAAMGVGEHKAFSSSKREALVSFDKIGMATRPGTDVERPMRRRLSKSPPLSRAVFRSLADAVLVMRQRHGGGWGNGVLFDALLAVFSATGAGSAPPVFTRPAAKAGQEGGSNIKGGAKTGLNAKVCTPPPMTRRAPCESHCVPLRPTGAVAW